MVAIILYTIQEQLSMDHLVQQRLFEVFSGPAVGGVVTKMLTVVQLLQCSTCA